MIAIQKTGGSIPRNFEIMPDSQYLIAAQQSRGDAVLFERELHHLGEEQQAMIKDSAKAPWRIDATEPSLIPQKQPLPIPF